MCQVLKYIDSFKYYILVGYWKSLSKKYLLPIVIVFIII